MDVSREHDFTEFYDATWPRTVACSYALTGDLGEAQDIAQEAYSRAWPRWSSLRGYDDPGAWVRQVATRLAVSRWRRARTAAKFLSRTRGPEPAAPPSEATTDLVAALKQLPEAQRRAVVLHHFGELSVVEIARIEKCPDGTIKARLAHGRGRGFHRRRRWLGRRDPWRRRDGFADRGTHSESARAVHAAREHRGVAWLR